MKISEAIMSKSKFNFNSTKKDWEKKFRWKKMENSIMRADLQSQKGF
jgi:hypothetical protein